MMNCILFGGTGTLGKEVVRRLYGGSSKIAVFSRDECKQQAMKKRYPAVTYYIGDIRDEKSVASAIAGFRPNVVFNFAAMKHVDVCEYNAREALLTNYHGALNVAEACCRYQVPSCVYTSTDKAVQPINVYGMTKAITERHLLNLNARHGSRFRVFRWGNILGSRGSVVQHFAQSLMKNQTVEITDERMTRFWLTIDEACSFMLENSLNGKTDRVLYPENMKACKVLQLAAAVAFNLKTEIKNIRNIGMRAGEKIHECMDADIGMTSENADRFSPTELNEIVARVL